MRADRNQALPGPDLPQGVQHLGNALGDGARLPFVLALHVEAGRFQAVPDQLQQRGLARARATADIDAYLVSVHGCPSLLGMQNDHGLHFGMPGGDVLAVGG